MTKFSLQPFSNGIEVDGGELKGNITSSALFSKMEPLHVVIVSPLSLLSLELNLWVNRTHPLEATRKIWVHALPSTATPPSMHMYFLHLEWISTLEHLASLTKMHLWHFILFNQVSLTYPKIATFIEILIVVYFDLPTG